MLPSKFCFRSPLGKKTLSALKEMIDYIYDDPYVHSIRSLTMIGVVSSFQERAFIPVPKDDGCMYGLLHVCRNAGGIKVYIDDGEKPTKVTVYSPCDNYTITVFA